MSVVRVEPCPWNYGRGRPTEYMFIKHGDSIHTGMSMVLSKWIIYNPYISRLNMRPANR